MMVLYELDYIDSIGVTQSVTMEYAILREHDKLYIIGQREGI